MDIRIEMSPDNKDEIVIKCSSITPEIIRLQQLLSKEQAKSSQLVLYKGATEYYLDAGQVLFFETEGNMVVAHTLKDVFETRMKLYELEILLAADFQRVSKSTIANVKRIYSICRNLTASSVVEFYDTHKTVYVSRSYYKALRARLEEKR